jgi:endonuclease/exonuclease/phosphatase family metal-dependent hydrolase
VKIVSWNMNHWRRTPGQRERGWRFLQQLEPDIALLQEAMPEGRVLDTHRAYRVGGIGQTRPWGSAVVSFTMPVAEVTQARSRHSKSESDLHRTCPGSVAIGHVSGITAISQYGLIEDGYAVTTVQRQLSDLTPLFDSAQGERVVLAGDLNLSTQFPEPDRSRHHNVMERFESLGLVDCLALDRPPRGPVAGCPCVDDPCRHVRTQRHPKSETPWQNDYFFVSRKLAAAVTSCRAVDHGDPDPWALSDHCPLVLELDVGATRQAPAADGCS